MNRFISTLAVLAVTPASLAQIVVDGTAEKAYGEALAVQNVQTGFGNATQGQIDLAFGSEIDGIFARIEGGILFVVIAGNLESNFNKLDVFFDTREGGQNRLRGDNPNVDFDGLNRMGDDGTGNGLTFDECFSADFYVTATNGIPGGGSFSTFSNISQILTDGGGIGVYIGSGGAGTNIINNTEYGVQVGLNNSNTGGVDGGNGPADGSGVRTGVELALPLDLLGVDPVTPQNIKICAFINGSGHDFASNQFIAPLGPDTANLGEPRFVNLAAIPGNQYAVVEIVPGQPDCPGTSDCPADLDGDGTVGGPDLTTLLAAWGSADADIDGDGNTSGTDLTSLLAAWGTCP